MARKKKRIPRNMGRIEFIACHDVIDAMRVQGYDNKKIHAALVKKGKVTMSYATFCYHMVRFLKEIRERQEQSGHPPTQVYAQTIFKQHGYKDHGFSVNKTPSSDEMI
jgi:hypothetical protein